MASEVVMPKMGYDMTEGTILKWTKQEGDEVKKGDVLGEIETGKVNIEIESFDAGVLRKILVGEGETVDVGTPIAVIGGADEEIELPSPNGEADADAAGATAPEPADEREAREAAAAARRTDDGAPPSGADGRVRASPLARRLAEEHGVDLGALDGSGPSGRIVRDDVLAAVEAAEAEAEVMPAERAAPVPGQREALSRMRQTIARRLSDSWRAAPHIFLTMSIDMTDALALRKDVNAALAGETPDGEAPRPSVNDWIVKACALALREHPRLNVSWDDGDRVLHERVNVGVAVALEDGLITITVPDADQKRLSTIAAAVRDKAERARAGALSPEDLETPSTFTVSNLGMYGIDHFTAIINPPEAAILAVGAARPTPVVVDGEVAVRSIMKVTLSADHRVVDGATAAEFLVTLRDLLERPLAMLA